MPLAAVTPPLAFLSRKKRTSSTGPGFGLPSNQSTSLFTTGSSTLHLSNCSVTVLSLDPSTLPSRSNGGNGGNNVTTVASAAAAAGASRSLAAGVGAKGATSFDGLVGEAVQTIGACVHPCVVWRI